MTSTKQPQQVPKLYTLEKINGAISSPQFDASLLEAIRDGFVSYSSGDFNACPIQTMGAPPMAPFSVINNATGENYAAQTCVKSGYLTGAAHYVIKVASGGSPLPANSGLMQLYSQTSGRLEALLLDEGILTELRTAAAGAVAAELLAPTHIVTIGMLGTGVQARYQLRYLKLVTSCRTVLVWGRTADRVESFREDMAADGWTVDRAASPDELLERCDLIVTTTSSRDPLLGAGGGGRKAKRVGGQHISCIGADATGKKELQPELIAQADLLVADSRLQTQERGEFEEAISRGLVSIDDVVEIGELIRRKDLHRSDQEDNRITIFDSSGVAVQDCVVAKIVYDTLVAQDSGK